MKVLRDDGMEFEAHCFGGDWNAMRDWAKEHVPEKEDGFLNFFMTAFPDGWKLEQLLPIWVIREGDGVILSVKAPPINYKIL